MSRCCGFWFFLGPNFVPACGGRPVNCSKILCSSAASFSSIIYPAWGEWGMRRTHDFICLFASLMENRRRDLKWEFLRSEMGKLWGIWKLRDWSCTCHDLALVRLLIHQSHCLSVRPIVHPSWFLLSGHRPRIRWNLREMTSNLWTGRPSRPITTIDGFTTARLSSEKSLDQIFDISADKSSGFAWRLREKV